MIRRQTHRIYFPSKISQETSLVLTREMEHYIKNVLRIKLHEKLRVFNEVDGEFLVRISLTSKKEMHVTVESKLRERESNLPSLTLGLCMIKADRFATAIDMSVQLGVTKIIPIISKYTVHRNFNIERTRRIIIEATEQSERLFVPDILEPLMLSDIDFNSFGSIFYANELEKDRVLKKLNIENPLIIIGPEGGFSEDELQFLSKQTNAHSISLGENVLRSETACCKAISYLQFLREKHA